MKVLSAAFILFISTVLVSVSAFAPTSRELCTTKTTTQLHAEDDNEQQKGIGERLWGEPTKKDEGGAAMSKALPFTSRPKFLDGALPGDAGFDPFSLAQDKETLWYMREAEIKHSRLAMLAVVGWPLAELYDQPIAQLIGRPALLTKSGESPSLLNGGLDKIDIEYWVLVIALAGLAEVANSDQKKTKAKDYVLGDCGFDPLNLFPGKDNVKGRFEMQTKEIKHGRVAMMAIVGFAIQEALYGIPVVNETPFFFRPIF